ncbi:MAG: hypothetical protein ACK2UB_05900 [Anaerolineales bacterium]
MKKIIIVAAFLLAMCAVLLCISAAFGYLLLPKPQITKSEAGRFAVTAPTALTLSEQTIPVAEDVDIDLHIFVGQYGNIAYSVGYADYPEEIFERYTVEELLELSRDGVVNSGGRTLISESAITVEGYPGVEFVVEERTDDEADIAAKGRIFFVGMRIYVLLITAPKGKLDDGEMNEFLDSFQLL